MPLFVTEIQYQKKQAEYKASTVAQLAQYCIFPCDSKIKDKSSTEELKKKLEIYFTDK